ncbi:unnamed protein product [Protopolystoma xenopodis]|uniref:Uncharacterized protein n=1 Tax=Protopolystoma xenopodis TaxID=117903 RepID=A0A3S5AY32_9PLAT|nr:unnamed protein product [Protopolystoma xenopodis]
MAGLLLTFLYSFLSYSQAYCVRGGCRESDGWCRVLWGKTGYRAGGECFQFNLPTRLNPLHPYSAALSDSVPSGPDSPYPGSSTSFWPADGMTTQTTLLQSSSTAQPVRTMSGINSGVEPDSTQLPEGNSINVPLEFSASLPSSLSSLSANSHSSTWRHLQTSAMAAARGSGAKSLPLHHIDLVANCGKLRPEPADRWNDIKAWPGKACLSR